MRHRRGYLPAVPALLLALWPAALHAQDRPVLSGYWVGAGLAGGIGNPSCSQCSDDQSITGISADLSVGWLVSQRFRLMVNITGWRGSTHGITEHYGFALATAEYLPFDGLPVFVRGGIGVARNRTALKREPEGGTDNLTGLGPGAEVGIGYDARLGRTLVATAGLSYLTTLATELTFNGVGSGLNVRHSLIRGGVALRWFWSELE